MRPARARPVARTTCSARTLVGEAELRPRRGARATSCWHVAELDLYVVVVPVAATIVLVGARALARRAAAGVPRRDRRAHGVLLVPVVAAFASRLRATGSRSGTCSTSRRCFCIAPARLDRARRAATARPRAGRRGSRPRCSSLRDPVRPLHHDVRALGHAHAAAVVVASRTASARAGSRSSSRSRSRVALAAAFLLRAAARTRSRCPLVVLASGSSRSSRSGRGRTASSRLARARSSRASATRRSGLDRRGAARRRRGRRSLDRPHRPLHREPERVLQPRASGRSTTSPSRRPGGLPETRVTIDPRHGPGDASGRQLRVDDDYRPRRRVVRARTARRSRATRAGAITVWRGERAARLGRRGSTASTRTTPGRAPTVTYTRRRCAAGPARPSTLSSDPSLFLEPQTIVARSTVGGGDARLSPGRREPNVPVAAPRRAGRECRVVFTVTPTAVPAEVIAGRERRPRARRALQPLRLQAARDEDRVRRQPARRTRARDRELHPRDRSAGSSRPPAASTRSSRSRRRACAGPARIRSRARRDRRRAADVAASPFSHALRTAWSLAGRPAAERLLGPFDVLHFSDWMYPPQRAGVRATTIHDLVPLRIPSGRRRAPARCTARKYANAARTCDVVFVNSAYTGRRRRRTLGVPAERIRVAHPASRAEFRARRRPPPTSARRTCSPSRRSSRARTCRRSSRRTGCSAATSCSPSPAPRVGASSRCSTTRGSAGSATSPTRSSRASTAARPSRLPVALRGLRHADRRGDGVRHPGGRVVAPVARRGLRRRGGPRRPRRSGRDRRRDRAGARGERRAPRRAGLEHAARFTWRAVGRDLPARLREAAR